MPLKLITAPDEEPVFLEEAKIFCRVDGDDEDQLIEAIIIAAREMAEQRTKRALITQIWDLSIDEFPSEIVLPYPPLQSVTYVKYVDTDGVLQTLASSNYTVDIASEPGRIVPAYGITWPSTRCQINAVTVRFVCGYLDAEAVPEAIKSWMKVQINTMSEFREEFISGTIIQPLPNQYVDRMLDRHIIY
jgi:uncharacterized phiE125 gp8 family phage protein